MLGKILPPDLARKAYQQMVEMEWRKLLYIISRDSFVYFPHHLGNTLKTYRFGTQGNGTQVEFEVRIQITGSNDTGLSCLPENYMPDYLEAALKMLKHGQRTLECMPPLKRQMLPKVRKDGNFPSKEELKEYIAESYSLADGTIQWFDFYCTTSYEMLGKIN